MPKLTKHYSFQRALALLDRRHSIEQTVAELRRRYHQKATLEQVKRAYFPSRGLTAITRLAGKTHDEILAAMKKITEVAKKRDELARQRLKQLHQDPEFAKKRDERLKQLYQDPEFAKKHAELARQTMKQLNQDPEFAKKRDERMKQLHQDPEFAKKRDERARQRMKQLRQDPEFAKKIREGLARFWTKFWGERRRRAKASFDSRTERYETPVMQTPEKIAEEHEVLAKALESLPEIHRTVLAQEFSFELQHSQEALETAAELSEKERTQIIEAALKNLRKNKQLFPS